MLAGTAPVAYCYYVREAARAVIGSLFASASHRDSGIEEQLLEHVLDEALADPESPRVECQTLFSTAAGSAPLFASRGFESRDRHYLERDLAIAIPAPRRADCLRPVRKADLPAIAEIVWCSHKGSLDASLNLTYATLGDCRRFVEMLVLRGACGRFDPAASFVAEWAGRPVGVILASRLSRSAGHVCQVSVRPDAQARGLGEALMEASLVALREQGLDRATLSVTVGNRRAQDLYRRLGFRLRRAFAAHAWARPAAGAGATA
jgi:ribosomal protein S18 acetylase RimI-like enzyme